MFIYLITNDVNDKAYVGLHSGRDLRKRWTTHRSFARRGSRSLISLAIRKHGAEKFHITSVWSGHIPLDNLKILERYFIRCFRTKHPDGYNLTDGGDGTFGLKHTDAERRARSLRMKLQIQTGNIPPHKGLKRPSEIWRRISAAKTGKKRKPFTAEAKANMSAALMGNKHMLGSKQSAETVAKRVASRAGYKHSEETKAKIRESNRRLRRPAP